MVALPGVIAVTTPAAVMVATDVLLLDHTPLGVELDKVVEKPLQIPAVPVIEDTAGKGLTVSVKVTAVVQLFMSVIVYEIVALPGEKADIVPVPVIWTIDGSLVDHVPPEVELDKFAVLPEQILEVPVIGFTVGLILTVIVLLTATSAPLNTRLR